MVVMELTASTFVRKLEKVATLHTQTLFSNSIKSKHRTDAGSAYYSDGCKTARMRVYLDILEEAAYVYARNADGSVQRYEETDTLNVPPQHYAGDPIVPAHNARGTWDMTVAGDSMPFIPTQVAASAPLMIALVNSI